MIQGWYCKEKLDVSHSWGSKGWTYLTMLPGVGRLPHFPSHNAIEQWVEYKTEQLPVPGGKQ